MNLENPAFLRGVNCTLYMFKTKLHSGKTLKEILLLGKKKEIYLLPHTVKTHWHRLH